MSNTQQFSDVVEAVEQLAPDEQETLVEIVTRRLAERNRQTVIQEVIEARQEYHSGRCKPTSVDDLMREIMK